MNRTEFKFNKQLLKTVSIKKKEDGGFKDIFERTGQKKVTLFDL
jgi:hypothetical protein